MVLDTSKLKDGFRVYPALRDHPLRIAGQWLKGRRIDDKLDGLWRVHDKVYDLTDFANRHPGGKEWIEMTKGTDITEVFESSHVNPSVQSLLDKYYVKPAETERITPYTFHPDGFYATLKRRAHAELSGLSAEQKKAGRRRAVRVQNALLGSLGLLLALTALTGSYWFAFATGIVLFLNMTCTHNFFHQRDNWRMFAFDLGLLSSYEWRVTHALSHHVYTNSAMDFEMSDLEPWFDFRVYPKGLIRRFLPAFLILTISQFYFFNEALKRIIAILIGLQKPRLEHLLPLATLAVFFLFTDRPVTLWLVMQATASYIFSLVGIAAAHHHPDLYHSGDGQFSLGNDWGLAQLDAVRDRSDVNGILLAELTMFGNHILHHLFPTVDHGLLDTLKPIFQETCKDFGIPDDVALPPAKDQFHYFLGMMRQMARAIPRPSFKTSNNNNNNNNHSSARNSPNRSLLPMKKGL